MIRVYVAGPYTANPEKCTHDAILQGDVLISLGFAPFIPHLSHYQHALYPRDYEDWMKLDFEWVSACDVLYRLPGESSGADREVAFAKARGIPVVYSLSELLEKFNTRG
jgi:nucleoside 2-deoxyribosyltransferase